MKRIEDVLANRQENYIFPFLWMHGEGEEVLRKEIKKIYENGCHAFCVEARPHPDFVGPGWWKDMDIILDEAKKRDMKVWILDDSHFPTGYANGAIKERYPELKKRFLKLHELDFCGPMEHAQAIIRYAFADKDDKLVGVFLAKKESYTQIDPDTLTDISAGVWGKKNVKFSLPEGEWRLFVVTSTYKGGESQTEDYLNPIDPAATDVLLEEVYEKHYAKYSDDFGRTIQGFFSDEPRFGNIHGPLSQIGTEKMVLPWREDLLELFEKEAGCEVKKYLPLLWVDGGEKAHVLRYHYMNLISRLYSENFSRRLGNWCEKHRIMYIGHTIEDNNAHARTGYGAGHFFRAMAGQHMAGIDVVLHQLIPGMDHGYNKAMTSNGWDGEFFHYTLAKLGSSLAHITPQMQGRCMCEVFGAYGWAEGTRMMKWIIDHMLVRGVNQFVPHAYSPKKYPDVDCPPHFFAEGNNPQNDEFGILMNYTNKMSHLLSGGNFKAPVALLYHGEAEWSGTCMMMQRPAACLTRNQIDFDIIPTEAAVKSSCNGTDMIIENQTYQAYVIPYAEALPAALIEKLAEMAESGFPVLFMEQLPERSSEGKSIEKSLFVLKQHAKVMNVEELADYLKSADIYDVNISTEAPYLRYIHYSQKDGEIYFFVNEAPYEVITTDVMIPVCKSVKKYDAFHNELELVKCFTKDEKTIISLTLQPYESVAYIFTDEEKELPFLETEEYKRFECQGPYQVECIRATDYPKAQKQIELNQLVPMQEVDGLEDFCGIFRYIWKESIEKAEDLKTAIHISGLTEAVRVFVNGVHVSTSICPPWEADISDYIKSGENEIALEVTTTLVRENYDWLSQFMLIEPTGITGKIEIVQERVK